MASLSHVAHSISSCLDNTDNWTLESPTKTGSMRLLNRLAAREWPGVASRGHVDALIWWRTKYLPNCPDAAASIVIFAAAKGHVHVLQWLHDTDGHVRSLSKSRESLVCSHPEAIRWILRHSPHAKLKVWLEKPAERGDLKFITWVEAQRSITPVYFGALKAAAGAGRLNVVKNLMKPFPRHDVFFACINAAEKDHLHVIKWLLANSEDNDTTYLISYINENGHFDMMKWFVEEHKWREGRFKNDWVTQNSTFSIVGSGDLEIAQWLLERGAVSAGNLMLRAVGTRDLDVVCEKGLCPPVEHEPENHRDFMLRAVETGSLEMVKWVHDSGLCPRTPTRTMDRATLQGLDMVKWRPEGSSTLAMDIAAGHGHLDVLRFLYENRSKGCSAFGFERVVADGRLDVVKFLVDHKLAERTKDAMKKAAVKGHSEIVKLLHTEENAAKALSVAAYHGHSEIVQWLVENRLKELNGVSGISAAATNGHRRILAYLAQYWDPDPEDCSAQDAVECAYFDLLEWLLRSGVLSVSAKVNKEIREAAGYSDVVLQMIKAHRILEKASCISETKREACQSLIG